MSKGARQTKQINKEVFPFNMRGWRNWQTQRTQNPSVSNDFEGSIPSLRTKSCAYSTMVSASGLYPANWGSNPCGRTTFYAEW